MRFLTFAFCAVFFLGCSKPEPAAKPVHDPHDVPITKADVKMPANFVELVSRIESYNQQIKTAIESGKPETGHRALDELDIVLDETMTLAKGSVPEDQLAKVNEARQTIKNSFLELHQSIDAKEKPNYSAKEQAIQKAIDELKRIASTAK